ncbi:GNAT family N-acetyltransferase [Paenibacillus sp. Marseille-Q4541]|uniref:GNAT family N-acetyltransferase n=1 Tax=Paenibacillus sp. Marseille-Q4541 TaxID=2831522 RepID=UPI001BA50036|nr:GNAT family N-acetyltransferase [Paenibacillus sp. Marseille-Q4541]
MLEIIEIPYEDKVILNNLIQFYRYDSSEFDEHVLNDHGVYLYKYLDHQWTDHYRHPYFLKVGGEIAGFALVISNVPRDFVKVSTAKETNVISDFFIMRKFRNKGYGKQAAHTIFNKFKGTWEVRQTTKNLPANKFWNKVIHDYTAGEYSETIVNNEKWQGPIQVFQNKK